MDNDLLSVSRIQSGRISLKITPVNLSLVINETLYLASGTTNNHQFITHIPSGLPQVLADRDKLAQIITNLLSNAIKYSPKGGEITIAVEPDITKQRATISVSDQGIGISQEDEHSLFKTFHRIQRPETMGIRVSGLGLYIAKEWTEAMGGEIWLKREIDKESTFYIGMPLSKLG